MGDSACLMHGFSYTGAHIPNQSWQGNSKSFLSESVSFGRFVSEPLSWDKWSTFPHKKYVEEAASYAQPGSVAEKKAFFEAHYKKIAAQKAAAEAEAAALLEKENKGNAERVVDNADDDTQTNVLVTVNEDLEKRVSVSLSENLDADSGLEGSGTPQMERPLLKGSCVDSEDTSSATSKKKHGLSLLKSSIRRKTWRVPSTPATPGIKKENHVISQSAKKSNVESTDKKRPSHKSSRGLINLVPFDKEPASVAKKAAISTTPKDCRTPIMQAAKDVAKYPAATPRSDNRRMKTPIDPCDNGNKTAAPKWQILSNVYTKSLTACRNKLQSPASSTPFMLRTEERAARRKQKLEEKFNANEEQKEKAGNEIRKLSYSFCFKARPLPDFYKERETSVRLMYKTPATRRPQTAVLGRNSSKKHGTVSVPCPSPPPKPSTKNGTSSKKKAANPSKFLTTSLPQRITHENRSPNIQH
ncbi:protein WVD2-like 7 isoform X2 [Salvia splendens]|uniref:protein WVD2-like 7 isoform X2 n=1 Tax=Salvia splendens TaxID=180675 RepID=UPI001C25AC5E|nr:protein WVD2-like 7 isoform X2 [Salvia splendens]